MSDAGVPTEAHRCGSVAIVGRPSVGKSTLLNALVGQKISITSRKPQTTRHRIMGVLTEPHAQFVFVDTPGFQTRHRSVLNRRMNATVRASLADVDVIVLVVDAARIADADREVIALLPKGTPVIAAVNKTDALADKRALLPRLAELARLWPFTAIVPVSAERVRQLDDLKAEIAKQLPAGPALYADDTLTDRDERFLAAELIREKIFRLLGDEVPYATTVTIERFEEDGKLRRIAAVVLVERAGQRAILVGEGGATMKAIASDARRDMETLFGGKVFLEVFVRVRSGWSESEATLKRLGYE
ncbi:MAG: GTPase Era [Proteobacteria bacterium]|nr:GTPase Era [Pseudomonadota bacterium]